MVKRKKYCFKLNLKYDKITIKQLFNFSIQN